MRSTVLDRQIEFTVEDRGPGIQADHLSHVFERFYQIEGGKEQVHNSGLGLSIAKGLIELHGGSIRVESKMGRGTLFTITLPRAKSGIAGQA
jgi:signal transduction histidine kinase